MSTAEKQLDSPSPTISIVLCTYNGAKFLSDQLDSLRAQDRLPHEVVICDDASTDDTLSILYDFAGRAPFPVRVEPGAVNLGFIANFERGIGYAAGDVIALCDQDDVWKPNKLTVMEAIFRNPSTALAFSDGDVVDETLAPLNTSLFTYASFSAKRRLEMHAGNAFDVLLDGNVVTGATAAFRSCLRESILPIPKDTGRLHDAWIALIAAGLGDVDFSADKLVLYRQHPDQFTGIRPMNRPAVLGRHHYATHAAFLELLRARISQSAPSAKRDDSLARLDDRLAHVKLRAELPSARAARIGPVLREACTGRYGKYSSGIKSVLRDLM